MTGVTKRHSVVLIFAAPRSVLLSMIADVICLSVILLLSLGKLPDLVSGYRLADWIGSMAALTDVNAAFRGCRGDIVFCALGNTTLAVGWCLVVLVSTTSRDLVTYCWQIKQLT